MRLSSFEKHSILTHFKTQFSNSKLFLFGSRVDDNKKETDANFKIRNTR